MPRWCSTLLLSLGIASSASGVSIDWVPVGNPGNACDPITVFVPSVCVGAVNHEYRLSKFEITNPQYAEFLNAKAASDPLGLYNSNMAGSHLGNFGIQRSGAPGSYTYEVHFFGMNTPVNYVSIIDAMRFGNWLHNGQGDGDTETGAYTLLGGTAIPANAATVTRNQGAKVFLPCEHEWYKAPIRLFSWGLLDYPGSMPTHEQNPTNTTPTAPTALAPTGTRASWATTPVRPVPTGRSTKVAIFSSGQRRVAARAASSAAEFFEHEPRRSAAPAGRASRVGERITSVSPRDSSPNPAPACS